MALYLLRRVAVLAVGAAVASVLVFALMTVLPGDTAQVALGVNATPAALAAERHAFGLDRPLVVQFADWAGGLLRGDLGISHVTQAPIAPQIAGRLGVT